MRKEWGGQGEGHELCDEVSGTPRDDNKLTCVTAFPSQPSHIQHHTHPFIHRQDQGASPCCQKGAVNVWQREGGGQAHWLPVVLEGWATTAQVHTRCAGGGVLLRNVFIYIGVCKHALVCWCVETRGVVA